MVKTRFLLAGVVAAASLVSFDPSGVSGQSPRGTEETAEPASLSRLLLLADSLSPRIQAARWGLRSARAGVEPAGALPDPALFLAVRNMPVVDPGFGNDFMTMAVVGVRETFPFPGKRGLREAVARSRAEAAEAELDRARRSVRARVGEAYFDLYEVDRSLEVALNNRELLSTIVRTAGVRYRVGEGGQADVLRARVERARLDDRIAGLRERRTAAVARLNALLARPSDTPVPALRVPASVEALALDPESRADGPSFGSSEDARRESGVPGLPSVEALQTLAAQHSPMVNAHVRRIDGRRREVELAEKATLPDISVSVGYAQRSGFTDMMSAEVTLPLPVFQGRKQDREVVAAQAVLAKDEALHHDMIHRINEDVAELVAKLRGGREQLRLYALAILPQARAGLDAARADYRVGRAPFLSLLDAQVTLFDHELAYHRLLADFATQLARLEEVVGLDVEEMIEQ